MNSGEQYNVQHALNGLEVTGYLFTDVDQTKQVKPNYAFLGRVTIKWQQSRRKEGRCSGGGLHWGALRRYTVKAKPKGKS